MATLSSKMMANTSCLNIVLIVLLRLVYAERFQLIFFFCSVSDNYKYSMFFVCAGTHAVDVTGFMNDGNPGITVTYRCFLTTFIISISKIMWSFAQWSRYERSQGTDGQCRKTKPMHAHCLPQEYRRLGLQRRPAEKLQSDRW